MISALKKLARASGSFSGGVEFNGRLPIGVEVLQKRAFQTYLLRIGTKELLTKSAKELEEKELYWALLKEARGKSGDISLTQLIQKPPFFQERILSLLPAYNFEELQSVSFSLSFLQCFKKSLLQTLASTHNREDFLVVVNLLEALERGYLTLLLKHGNKRTIVQLCKKKSQSQPSSEDGIISFYAGFEHLGPVEGIIYVQNGLERVRLFFAYEESLALLQSRDTLGAFDVELGLKKGRISPLYEPVASLLDLKG